MLKKKNEMVEGSPLKSSKLKKQSEKSETKSSKLKAKDDKSNNHKSNNKSSGIVKSGATVSVKKKSEKNKAKTGNTAKGIERPVQKSKTNTGLPSNSRQRTDKAKHADSNTSSTASKRNTANIKKSVSKQVERTSGKRTRTVSVSSTPAPSSTKKSSNREKQKETRDVVKYRAEKSWFTDTIQPPKAISGKISDVRNHDLIEITIDGNLYQVSPWSVKDGVYIQGLDSNFIVQHYKLHHK